MRVPNTVFGVFGHIWPYLGTYMSVGEEEVALLLPSYVHEIIQTPG